MGVCAPALASSSTIISSVSIPSFTIYKLGSSWTWLIVNSKVVWSDKFPSVTTTVIIVVLLKSAIGVIVIVASPFVSVLDATHATLSSPASEMPAFELHENIKSLRSIVHLYLNLY